MDSELLQKLIGAHAKFGKDNVTLGVGERGRGLFLSDKYLKTIAATKRAQSSSVKALKFGEQQVRRRTRVLMTRSPISINRFGRAGIGTCCIRMWQRSLTHNLYI